MSRLVFFSFLFFSPLPSPLLFARLSAVAAIGDDGGSAVQQRRGRLPGRHPAPLTRVFAQVQTVVNGPARTLSQSVSIPGEYLESVVPSVESDR